MWLGLVCAVVSAVCYGAASAVQSVAARATADDTRGVDPRLVFRLLRQWRYLASLGLDIVGLVTQVTALRVLPLFLVQAAMAGSIVVTALIAGRWFGARLSWPEWLSVGGRVRGSGHARRGGAQRGRRPRLGRLPLRPAGIRVPAGGDGRQAGRLADPARTVALGLISGLGFGTSASRCAWCPVWPRGRWFAIRRPTPRSSAGILAAWFYAAALQRGGVVAATATMLIGETVPAAVIGVLLLGDHARPGWLPVAVGRVRRRAGGCAGAGPVRRDRASPEPETAGRYE